MRYQPFMKPFVKGMHILMIPMIIGNCMLIGTLYTFKYYIINVIFVILLGHFGLKAYETFCMFILKLTNKNQKM